MKATVKIIEEKRREEDLFMRKRKNHLVDGILLIALALMLFSVTALCYPLLTFSELFKLHPYGSWGIPLILIILGLVSIEIYREEKKRDE